MKPNANVIRAVLLLSIGLLAGATHGQASLKGGNVLGDWGSAVEGANNQSQPLGEVVAAETLVRQTFKATETVPGLFQAVQLRSDGQVQISLNAPEGERYAVNISTNLLDWVTLKTFVATSDLMEVLVADASTDPYRFYRLELLSSDESFTTVSGRVLNSKGLPVEGATVEVTVGTFRKAGMTDSEGRYVIKEVPSDLGNLVVSAYLGVTHIPSTAGSALLIPVPGGVTGVAPLVLERMAYIPPGTFVMGSPVSEAERDNDETQHQVTLTQGIWMGRYEVTQEEYLDVMGSNPSHFRNGTRSVINGSGGEVTNELEHPVEQVSWFDATNYCARLTERELVAGRIPAGYLYRLPTEAEWEYASRAGTATAFHYGKALRGGMANFYALREYDADEGSTFIGITTNYIGRTSVVGSYEPNGFGLYDMHGNVAEWCQDWYGAYRGTEEDPQGPVTGSLRVLRGGDWSGCCRASGSANRERVNPVIRGDGLGFRVVMAPERFTTVSGRVLDTNSQPVEGVTVNVKVGTFGKTGTTDSDGRYVIKEVPSDRGHLVVSAFLYTADTSLSAVPVTLTTVMAGLTDVETLVLEPGYVGMAYIPPGTYVMGSPQNEAKRSSDETQHQVMLTRGIFMGRYEVTQGEYLDVMGSNPSFFRNGTPPLSLGNGGEVMNELEHPVEQVNWADAMNYCARLTEREVNAGRIPAGYQYRLPTESEWEYACRAGTTMAFHYGKALQGGMANFDDLREYDSDVGDILLVTRTNYLGRTSPVGGYEPNGFGLYDMHGNVSEWCQDWYGAYPGTEEDPQGPDTGSLRVFRGGGWSSFGRNNRSAARFSKDPGSQGSHLGFRVVLVPEPITTVSGRVLDTNGQPVEGVTVMVTVGTFGKTGTTDSDGRYVVNEIPNDLGNLLVSAFLNTTNIPFWVVPTVLRPAKFGVTEVAPLVLESGFEGMSYIPPGTFVMGSPESEVQRDSDETQHLVTLTRGIFMGRYEVTQGEYLDVMGMNPSYFRNGRIPLIRGDGGVVTNELEHPVEQVNWANATNYCGLLTEREVKAGRIPAGYRYRLPTESEWEYACRAGTTTAFHYGKALRGGMSNFDALWEYDADVGPIRPETTTKYLGRTSPVGSYEPNGFGLYDMHGNVNEWCQDRYGTYPGTVVDPQGPITAALRVFRGGSWNGYGTHCRSANRYFNTSDYRLYTIGFRVVLEPGQP